jgi:hypothetical protein
MSKKDDLDNHSNQLNQNNKAYYSSRQGNLVDDDNKTWSKKPKSFEVLMADAVAPYSASAWENTKRQEFEFDFVSFDGQVALLSFIAVCRSVTSEFSDCIDIAEYMHKRLMVLVAKEFKCEVAFSQVRYAGSKTEFGANVGHRYHQPWRPSGSPESMKQYDMWKEQGEAAVLRLEEQIQSGTELRRESLGEVVK